MDDWLRLAIQLGVGLAIAVVTARVTAAAALARHRSERWWDRKADAYTQLLEAVFDAYRHEKRTLDEIETGIRFSSDEEQAQLARARQAWREIAKYTALGAFTISPEVASLLGKMDEHANEVDDPDDFYGRMAASVSAYDQYIGLIRDAALQDLRVKRR